MPRILTLLPLLLLLFIKSFTQAQTVEKVAPGIWKLTYGKPEKYLPTEFKAAPALAAMQQLPNGDTPPFDLKAIQFRKINGGVMAEMQVDTSERFYGFGLQTNAFEQRGMRRDIRINSWIAGNVGFGHASMPFYVSSKGYGVVVNTARYTTFYMASKGKLDESIRQGTATADEVQKIALNTVDLYGKKVSVSNEVSMLVNGTDGVEIFVLAGPEMKQVMQRYNLFSGGGALPPLWGLGFKYRAKATFTDQQVIEVAQYFREKNIPCDMLGLEPGWQTAAYSCSFKWNPKTSPTPMLLFKK